MAGECEVAERYIVKKMRSSWWVSANFHHMIFWCVVDEACYAVNRYAGSAEAGIRTKSAAAKPLKASMALPGGLSITMKSYEFLRGRISSDSFSSSPGSKASSMEPP